MYIEQRIYTANPGKLPAWLKNYEEIGGPASAKHMGPLLGMFTVEIGQINRVVFLRGFDDIDDREKGLIAREADPDWARFRAENAKLGALMIQESKLMKPTPWSPIQKAGQPFVRTLPGTGMFVDHRTYDFVPGKMQLWLDAYRDMGLAVQQRLLGQLLSFSIVECGPINQAVFMWGFTSLGDRDRRRGEMAKDPAWGEFGKAVAATGALKQQTTMVLRPVSFSPMR